jgi:uncharacterized protein DUF4199
MANRIAVKWGVILGIAVCVWTLALHLLGWYTTDLAKGRMADQLATIFPILAIFFAVRERGIHLGRAPTIRESLGTGLLTGAVSIPITVGFLWIYHHYINPRWLEAVIAYERERLGRSGATAEQIARRVDVLTTGATDSGQIVAGVVGTLLISLVISLLVWGVLRATHRDRSLRV